jgi:precorrin-6B methylase 1
MITTRVVKALIELGYDRVSAIELVQKHVDIVEVNENELSPKAIAEELEEAEMQNC